MNANLEVSSLSTAASATLQAADSESMPSTARPIPKSMRAIIQRRYGGAETLEMGTLAVPQPADGQVLIEVAAAGVDRGVWHLMVGLPWLIRLGFGLTGPKQPVPGLDVSGRVVAVGPAVDGFRVGDEVFGVGSGTFAEYAVAEARKLAHRPPEVSVEQAAALPISGMTALQAIRDVGMVRAGQRVLVLGASGGVGSFTVQIARHYGARVTGVASTSKLDFVRSLGAERVIDYTHEDALDSDTRYDVIIDIAGRRSVRALRRALAADGTLVIIGGEGGDRLTGGLHRQFGAVLLSPFVSQRLKMMVSPERGDDVEHLGALLTSGEIVAPVDRTYRLEDAPDALSDLAAGRFSGKAVVNVTEATGERHNQDE